MAAAVRERATMANSTSEGAGTEEVDAFEPQAFDLRRRTAQVLRAAVSPSVGGLGARAALVPIRPRRIGCRPATMTR